MINEAIIQIAFLSVWLFYLYEDLSKLLILKDLPASQKFLDDCNSL